MTGGELPLIGGAGWPRQPLRGGGRSAPAPGKRPKVAHVLAAGQTRNHACHWPGCKAQVPPAMWGCRKHWFRLPKPIRDRIWREYREGQEETGTPSREYVLAARAAQEWIAQNEAPLFVEEKRR